MSAEKAIFMLSGCLTLLLATFKSVEVDAEEQPLKTPVALSEDEKNAGWQLLFDGSSTKGWLSWKGTAPGAQWVAENGALYLKGKGGGDIITEQTYDNFELYLEWKISEGGNSGIFYRADPVKKGAIWHSAPEMQVLDDARHGDGKNPKTSAGSLYALYAPVDKVYHPAGEWNTVKIVLKGNHLEHWLNDKKILETTIGSEEWNELVSKSKFGKLPNFGKIAKGHIGLQDHGNPVWFRNIKLRVLPAE